MVSACTAGCLQELSKAVEGMEVLIAQMSTATSFMGHDFFNTIFSECLSDKCKVVIARIVGPKPTYRTGRSQRQQKTNEFLKIQGLDIERFKYKGKLCKQNRNSNYNVQVPF